MCELLNHGLFHMKRDVIKSTREFWRKKKWLEIFFKGKFITCMFRQSIAIRADTTIDSVYFFVVFFCSCNIFHCYLCVVDMCPKCFRITICNFTENIIHMKYYSEFGETSKHLLLSLKGCFCYLAMQFWVSFRAKSMFTCFSSQYCIAKWIILCLSLKSTNANNISR